MKRGPRWPLGRDGVATEPPVIAEDKTATERSNYFHRVARPTPPAEGAGARLSDGGHPIIFSQHHCSLQSPHHSSKGPVLPPSGSSLPGVSAPSLFTAFLLLAFIATQSTVRFALLFCLRLYPLTVSSAPERQKLSALIWPTASLAPGRADRRCSANVC